MPLSTKIGLGSGHIDDGCHVGIRNKTSRQNAFYSLTDDTSDKMHCMRASHIILSMLQTDFI